jgi:hypothetical protein
MGNFFPKSMLFLELFFSNKHAMQNFLKCFKNLRRVNLFYKQNRQGQKMKPKAEHEYGGHDRGCLP